MSSVAFNKDSLEKVPFKICWAINYALLWCFCIQTLGKYQNVSPSMHESNKVKAYFFDVTNLNCLGKCILVRKRGKEFRASKIEHDNDKLTGISEVRNL